jgi:hypothetical protein
MFPRGGRQTTRLGVAFWYFVISNMRMKLPARSALQIRAAASACCEAYLKNTVPIGLLAGYGDCPPTLAFCILCVGREAMAYQECSGNSSTRASAFHRLNGW